MVYTVFSAVISVMSKKEMISAHKTLSTSEGERQLACINKISQNGVEFLEVNENWKLKWLESGSLALVD